MFRNSTNAFLVPASSALFSMGFFTISFTFPLLAEHLSYGPSFIGLLGIFIGIPFALFALFMKNKDLSVLWKVVKYATLVMLPASLFFVVVNASTLIPLILLADLAAAAFFVAAEMGIGRSSTDRLAERYSAAWGIPNLIAPLVAGYILQISNFVWVYAIALGFFVVAVLFVPRADEQEVDSISVRGAHVSLMVVMPLLFAGISAGFFYYVFIPYLRALGTQYFIIGIVGSVPAVSSALGFLALERVKSRSWTLFALTSAILLCLPLLLYITHGFIISAAVFALSGVGSAIAFSKLLAYISKSSSSSQGVFYYEGLFGVGFIVGSLLGGFLFQYYGFLAIIVVFVPSLIYVVFFAASRNSPRMSAIS